MASRTFPLRRISGPTLFAMAAFFVGAAPARADGDQGVASSALPEGHITPLYADVAPQIDGALDDRVWRDCARRPTATAGAFIYRGAEGRFLAEEQTTVYVAYDEEALYVGARCEFANADAVVARILLRDQNLWYDDSFEVFLDTFQDGKSAYYFSVNPLNTQMDGYFSEEGEVENRNWDGVWYSATKLGADAWTCEFKIPFRTLRWGLFNREWGVNFARFHKATGDQTVWVDVGENLLRVSRFGTMEAPPRRSKRPTLDVQPYVSGFYRDLAKEDGGRLDHKEGVDVASRVLPSVNVVGTYRPDFAQVEADPYRINLTDEELFYPEKRPFFLEGQEYFDTPLQVLYSRRIGDIDYGGKVLGRVGPTHLYALALRADEYLEDADNPGGPYPYDWAVARVKQDITKYASLGVLGVRRTGETWRDNDALSADAAISFNDEVIFAGQFVRGVDGETGRAANGLELALNRYTSGLSVGAGYEDLDRNLALIKTAYIPYDDVRGYWGTADYNWWLYKIGVKKLNWNVNGEHYLNHGDALKTPYGPEIQRLQREGLDGEFGVYLDNRLSFRVLAERNYRQEIGKVQEWPAPYPPGPPNVYPMRESFENRYYAGTVGYNLEEWSSAYAFYEWGTHFGYDLQYWGGGYSFNPFSRLTLSYDLDFETLSEVDPVLADRPRRYYEFIINRLHGDLNLTDDLAARVFIQSTSDAGYYATNALLSYEFRKGCHVYLVYNEKRLYKAARRDEVGRASLDQLLFLKVNYLLGF
jgi:hypothetical protein